MHGFVLSNYFLSVLDSIAPLKQRKIKQRTLPWLDSDIVQAIAERDQAFHKYKREKHLKLLSL